MGGGQHDRRGHAVFIRSEPVPRGHAPTVAGYEAGEVVLGHRRAQVVANAALVFEKLRGHHGADRVAPHVFGSRAAAAVSVEAGHRFGAARLQGTTQHVAIGHGTSIASAGAPHTRSDQSV